MSRAPLRIAVADDDPGQRAWLEAALRAAGHEPISCADGAAALAAVGRCDLLLLDVRMPGMGGLEVLGRVKAANPGLPVLLLTAYIDVREAVAAVKAGAFTYLEKPVDSDELVAVIEDAVGAAGREAAPALPPYAVAESGAMRAVLEQASRAAVSDVTVLLLGESGVGKEVVARFIHETSARRAAPLVRVNCGALPEHLVESELFGHEKGAFTGAAGMRQGQFELAAEGTLFLDEIGELPLALQPKFLHVLETGQFRRVGGARELCGTARVVAATNRDLEAESRAGRFREDLFYRLSVFPLLIPPLRERPDDILPLAVHFARGHGKRLSPAAERLLAAYPWPGNVRELRNALERAAIISNGALILPTDLPPQVQKAVSAAAAGSMESARRRAIIEALSKTGGNKTQAAALLGISRRNLVYKLRDYGL